MLYHTGLILNLLALLLGLLDHTVQLLLCHADDGQLSHLRMSDDAALLHELLLGSRKQLLIVAGGYRAGTLTGSWVRRLYRR